MNIVNSDIRKKLKWNLKQNSYIFNKKKYWKCCLQNGGNFVSMCWELTNDTPYLAHEDRCDVVFLYLDGLLVCFFIILIIFNYNGKIFVEMLTSNVVLWENNYIYVKVPVMEVFGRIKFKEHF